MKNAPRTARARLLGRTATASACLLALAALALTRAGSAQDASAAAQTAPTAPVQGKPKAGPPRLETGTNLGKHKAPVSAPAKAPLPPLPGAGPVPPAPPETPRALGPAPRIELVDDRVVDFGTVVQGSIQSHVYRLRNAGDSDLVISHIRPSCGCTVPSITVLGPGPTDRTPYEYNQPIAPGVEAEIGIRLDTSNKHNVYEGSVAVLCNDPRGAVELRFNVNITPYVSIEPESVNFNTVRTGDQLEGKAVIKSHARERVKMSVDQAIALPSELKVALSPREPDAEGRSGEWDVHFTFGPGIPDTRRYTRMIRFVSDELVEGQPTNLDGSPNYRSVGLTVLAEVVPVVSLEPDFVSFGVLRPGQVASRTFTVAVRDGAHRMAEPTARVRGFDAKKNYAFEYADYVSTTVRQVNAGLSYEVELTINGLPESALGNVQGIVEITTGHPEVPKVEGRFTGLCRPGAANPQLPPKTPPPVIGKPAGAGGAAGGAGNPGPK